MCGIAAVASLEKKNLQSFVRTGVEGVLNRGYDSVGSACVFDVNKLQIIKSGSPNAFENWSQKIGSLAESHMVVSHTRWATHGQATEQNAHPIVSADGRFAVVHNGIITNHKDLRSRSGIAHKTDTDTEVVAQLMMLYSGKEACTLSVFKKVLAKCTGTWAIVMLDATSPTKMYIARNGSPLLLGINKDHVFIGSEQSVFDQYCQRFFQAPDSFCGEISICDDAFFVRTTSSELQQPLESFLPFDAVTPRSSARIGATEFSTFMEMEIAEQPQTIRNSLGSLGLERYKLQIMGFKHIIFLGCGSSFHACMAAAHFLRKKAIFQTVQAIDAGEFTADHIPAGIETGFVLVSQSGETFDLVHVLRSHLGGFFTIGIVNVPGSVIDRETTCCVLTNAGRETAVAATKTFTAQQIVLILFSEWFETQQTQIQILGCLPDKIRDLLPTLKETSIKWSKYLNLRQDLFIIGNAPFHIVCMEAALKIKEVSYVHAEALTGSSLKHGSIALVQRGMPVIILQLSESMRTTSSELKARGAVPMLITSGIPEEEEEEPLCKQQLCLPMETQMELMIVVPIFFQYLALAMAHDRSINPDKPRNLAKCVTV